MLLDDSWHLASGQLSSSKIPLQLGFEEHWHIEFPSSGHRQTGAKRLHADQSGATTVHAEQTGATTLMPGLTKCSQIPKQPTFMGPLVLASIATFTNSWNSASTIENKNERSSSRPSPPKNQEQSNSYGKEFMSIGKCTCSRYQVAPSEAATVNKTTTTHPMGTKKFDAETCG